jgi:hypothetical protein
MTNDDVNLPALIPTTAAALGEITTALRIPREMLPPDQQIEAAWAALPRLLNEIPAAYRTQHHARMCTAVSSGLFDAGINYAWNAAILRLRDRVRASA